MAKRSTWRIIEDSVPQYQFAGPVGYELKDRNYLKPYIPSEAVSEQVSGFPYDEYLTNANRYLTRPVFQGTPLNAKLIADAAKEFYGKTNYVYPLELLLSQAQFETSLGKKLKSKHNYFNVGNTDSGATRDYPSAEDSMRDYMNLMYNDYLNKGQRSVESLLKPKSFVNMEGNRYASNPEYEQKLKSQVEYIKNFLSSKQVGGSRGKNKNREPIPGAAELWQNYRNPNTVVAIANPNNPNDTLRYFPGRPQVGGRIVVSDAEGTPVFTQESVYDIMKRPDSRVYQDSTLVNKYLPKAYGGSLSKAQIGGPYVPQFAAPPKRSLFDVVSDLWDDSEEPVKKQAPLPTPVKKTVPVKKEVKKEAPAPAVVYPQPSVVKQPYTLPTNEEIIAQQQAQQAQQALRPSLGYTTTVTDLKAQAFSSQPIDVAERIEAAKQIDLKKFLKEKQAIINGVPKTLPPSTPKVESLDDIKSSMQAAYYDVTNPDPKISAAGKIAYTKLNQRYIAKIKELNEKAESDAGWLDSWVNEALPSMLSKPYQKFGLGDQPELYEQTAFNFETYGQKKEKEKQEYLSSTRIEDLGVDPNNRWKLRASASNDNPLVVIPYGNRAEREKNPVNIQGKGTLMHFLDQSPITGYLYPGYEDIINQIKDNQYIGILDPVDKEKGEYALSYIPKSQFKKEKRTWGKDNFYLRQVKFDDIDFNKKIEDKNFSGHTYWGMKTKEGPLQISSGKNEDIYNYSSGQSVVFIYPYKGQTRYTHFSGSPSEIRREAEKIKKEYDLDKGKLTLGIADAGSYSSNIKSSSGVINNELLNSRDMGYYNRAGYTGAGMVLKKQGGPVTWSIVEDRPMAQQGLIVPPAGMFDTGVQRTDATSTAAPQVVQNTVAAKQFQSDLKNPKVTESQFKEKHGISREQYRKRPSAFDVGMNQVWEGAKVPFKLIGADPDLIRENPVEGISQALAGTLMAELPVNEMYQATKQGISGLKKALGTESGLLSNAYKLNPFAYKVKPNAFYRQIGNTGLEDALESGVIRSADQSAFPRPYFVEGRDFSKLYSTGKGATGNRPSVIFETSGINKEGLPFVNPANTNSIYTPWVADIAEVPLSEGKLLEKDWLTGYKEVSKPSFTPKFKSEIDWAKWNSKTPNYPELISEYNAIEESTKKAGTWMKNPDGSPFQGTPEQFIHQQSSWFKKAFPDGFGITYRGANNNATFRGNLAKSDNPNLGAIFTGNKNSAVPRYGSFNRVIRPDELGKSHEGTPGYMQLAYKPSSNTISFTANMSNWDSIDRSLLPIEHRNMEAVTQRAKENPSIVTTDDIAKYIQDKNLDYAEIRNIMDGTFFGEEIIYNHKPNNYLKSLWHNLGFYDMSDPDAYKILVPGLAGTSAAGYIASQKSQPEIQKQGGKVTWQIID